MILNISPVEAKMLLRLIGVDRMKFGELTVAEARKHAAMMTGDDDIGAMEAVQDRLCEKLHAAEAEK